MSKITKFPVGGWKRTTNRRGKHSVSCIVTDRYLLFHKDAARGEEGTAVIVDVMTEAGDKPRKISSLVITLEQLRTVLNLYE